MFLSAYYVIDILCSLSSVIRPNTPDTAVTLDHSIYNAGYYYATSTMKDTAIGLMHTFIGSPLATNRTHLPTRAILRRMALFYHKFLLLHDRKSVTASEYSSLIQFDCHSSRKFCWMTGMAAHLPDPSNLDSIFDLFSFCTLLITLNAFDSRTYEPSDPNLAHDQNAIEFPERIACMYARGKVLELLDWLAKHYDFIDNATKKPFEFPLAQVLSTHLGDLHQTLLSYKEKALTVNLRGPDGCTMEQFKYQLTSALESLLHTDKAIYQAEKAHRNGETFGYLGWKTSLLFEIRLKKEPIPFHPQKGKRIFECFIKLIHWRHRLRDSQPGDD